MSGANGFNIKVRKVSNGYTIGYTFLESGEESHTTHVAKDIDEMEKIVEHQVAGRWRS